MDKLKYIKLENEDGSYSSSIPLSVDSDHVDVGQDSLTNVLNTKANATIVNESLESLSTEVNTQKIRIDNLATLEDGSTTGDAELIDIRAGFDGTNYNNAGDAVRSQIEECHDEIDKMMQNISAKVIWTPGHYIRPDLSTQGVNSYAISSAIDIGPGETVILYGYGYQDMVSMITLINDAGRYIQSLVQSENASKKYSYTNNTDAWQKVVLSSGRIDEIKVWKGNSLDNYIKKGEIDLTPYIEKDGENQVTIKNSEFLDVVYANIFDGNYINGYVIAGDSTQIWQPNNARYNVARTACKPNTTYTVIARWDGTQSFWIKICTATKILADNASFDGAVSSVRNASAGKKVITFTTGANDKYIYVQGPAAAVEGETENIFIQIAEGTLTDFTTNKYDDGYGVPNNKLMIPEATSKAKVIISPINSTNFQIKILDEKSQKYIVHTFTKVLYEDTIDYGDAQTTNVTTCNVWYAQEIRDFENHNIMQGNTNFIHSLAMSGHTGHVGAGHGCCVAKFNLFFADGKLFDPTTLQDNIECSSFRFTEQVEHYLRDSSKGTSAHSIPSLDENGKPIVTCIETLDGEWKVNNEIIVRNRLLITYDNMKFEQCHAGMCCGFYPYFDNVLVNNKEYVWNQIVYEDSTFSRINPIGGRVFGTNTNVLGDTCVLWGDKVRVTQRMIQTDATYTDKSNLLVWLPPSDNDRLKIYFMPVVTTHSAENIADGQEITILNNGDMLDTTLIRKIDITE